MENKNLKVVAYRYMWTTHNSDNLNIKMIIGVEEEHEKFMEAIKNDNNVKACSRVYLHEIDITKVEFYDKVKEEKKDGEK